MSLNPTPRSGKCHEYQTSLAEDVSKCLTRPQYAIFLRISLNIIALDFCKLKKVQLYHTKAQYQLQK